MDPAHQLTSERQLDYVGALFALFDLVGEDLIAHISGAGSTSRPLALRGTLEGGFELGRGSDDAICFQLGALTIALREHSFVEGWREEQLARGAACRSIELVLSGGLRIELEEADRRT